MGDVEAAKEAPLARDRSFGLRQLLSVYERDAVDFSRVVFKSYWKPVSLQCTLRNWARKVQAEVEQICFCAPTSFWRSSAIWEVDQQLAALFYSAKHSDATEAVEEPDV